MRERRVRRQAHKHHCRIIKRREFKHVSHADKYGRFMLVNENNWVLLGSQFDATLDEIEYFFRRRAAK